jgi:hypothetical protein
MTHNQKNDCQDKYNNRKPVNAMHEHKIDITFAAGIALAENIDISKKFAPDHSSVVSIS